jgi:hypothetical protein
MLGIRVDGLAGKADENQASGWNEAERKELQAALQWFGFYSAVIDGAFGPATRSAMAAWQEAGAQRATGVLTTAQRVALLSAYRGAMAELGLQRVTEPEAGIAIDLPLAMIRFDRYDPPFVRYGEVDGSGVTVLLNTTADAAALLPQLLGHDHAMAAPRAQMDLRTYGIGAQILRELGVSRMRLLGSPRRMPSMTGYGLEITGFIAAPAAAA